MAKVSIFDGYRYLALPGRRKLLIQFGRQDTSIPDAQRDELTHAAVGGKANYARCPGQALYEYTPKNCVCHFIVGQGGADSMYLVEVGADTYLFIVSPIGLATERQIIDSIQIPFQLPSD